MHSFWPGFVAFTALALVGACSSDADSPADAAADSPADAAADSPADAADGSTAETGSTVALPDAQRADSRADAANSNFSFFVTSAGGTNGGNLGGLTGADQRCQAAAAAVGAGGKTWHAYLSLSAGADGGGAVNARDRIGTGPWYNVRGELIATDVKTLHEEGDGGVNGITYAAGLDENGNPIPAGDADAGVAPEHDILTGSTVDGRAFPPVPDYTCAGWTSNQAGPPITMSIPSDAATDGAPTGSEAAATDAATSTSDAALVDQASSDANATTTPTARVGHVNRVGAPVCPFCTSDTPIYSTSWNSAHPTPGCSQTDLVSVGGIGRLYCFAIN